MKITVQVSLVLFFFVSSTHTAWRKKVCEGKYSANSCLGSYPCMEQFLRCDCVPRQFAGRKLEDLCWTSLAYEVGAPICCINIEKRQHTSRELPDASINTKDLLMSAIRRSLHRRNNIKKVNSVINNDMKPKPKDSRTKMATKTGSKHKRFVSKPPFTNSERTFPRSVPKAIITGTGNTNRNFRQEKVMTDFSDAFLHPGKEFDGIETENAYKGSGQQSLRKDENSDSVFNARVTESADGYPNSLHEESFTDYAYHESVPSVGYENEYPDSSLTTVNEYLDSLLTVENDNAYTNLVPNADTDNAYLHYLLTVGNDNEYLNSVPSDGEDSAYLHSLLSVGNDNQYPQSLSSASNDNAYLKSDQTSANENENLNSVSSIANDNVYLYSVPSADNKETYLYSVPREGSGNMYLKYVPTSANDDSYRHSVETAGNDDMISSPLQLQHDRESEDEYHSSLPFPYVRTYYNTLPFSHLNFKKIDKPSTNIMQNKFLNALKYLDRK